MAKAPEESCIFCGIPHRGACGSTKPPAKKATPRQRVMSSTTHVPAAPVNIDVNNLDESRFMPPKRTLIADDQKVMTDAVQAIHEILGVHPISVIEHQHLFTPLQVRAASWKQTHAKG